MANRKLKVILDTNLWISFLISNDYSKLDQYIFKKEITLLFSEELLEEFIAVASRPKYHKYFTNSDIQGILKHINQFAKYIEVTTDISECRDVKDNFLLSLAVDGSADFLVSGDQDLLDLKKIKGTQIISIADFLKII